MIKCKGDDLKIKGDKETLIKEYKKICDFFNNDVVKNLFENEEELKKEMDKLIK